MEAKTFVLCKSALVFADSEGDEYKLGRGRNGSTGHENLKSRLPN